MGILGKAFLYFITVVICACSLPASANIVSFDIGAKFNGDGTMTNPGPWVNATFDDGGSAGTVDLTITAVGLTDGEKVGEVYFNLDPALKPFQLAFSSPTKTGTFADPTINNGSSSKIYDQYKADGDGKYDILIEFSSATGDAFNDGEAVKYTITLASLTANSFDFLSNSTGSTGPFETVAHILDPGGVSSTSVWATIPEPATMLLLGLGGLLLRRKRNA